MKSLLCFGEVLIDFLNTGSTPVDGIELPDFRQFPGGAPANSAVAFAGLGGRVRFAGQVGDDAFGCFLANSLEHWGVDIRFLHTHKTASTALAFVSLDSDGDRSFSFYRDRTADVLFSIDQVSDDWFTDCPIFHICSNTLTNSDIASVTKYALDRARRANCIVSIDVNLRPGLWPGGEIDRGRCNAVVRSADIVKFAREEIQFLSNGDPERFVESLLTECARLIVVTDGGKPVEFYTKEHRGKVITPTVKVVDTTAAGDAFTAAILRGLCAASDLDLVVSDANCIKALLEFAVQCGSLTTTRAGAFPALPEFSEVEEFWTEMP